MSVSLRVPVPGLLSGLLCLLLAGVPIGVVRAQAASSAGVDLNTADAATLARELTGIGESRARAIVEHRRRHGPFRSVDELALVRGIGPKTVERNRARLRLGGAAPGGATGAAAVVAGSGASGAAPSAVRRDGRVVRGTPVGGQGPEIIEGMPRDGG